MTKPTVREHAGACASLYDAVIGARACGRRPLVAGHARPVGTRHPRALLAVRLATTLRLRAQDAALAGLTDVHEVLGAVAYVTGEAAEQEVVVGVEHEAG